MRRTRSSTTAVPVPPEIARSSAMVRVTLTRRGRRHARTICMCDDGVHLFHFTTGRDGRVTYTFTAPDGSRRDFAQDESYPEFVIV